MARVRQILTGWIAGELSRYMEGRIDTDQYRYGLSKCENFVPLNEGPLAKRPGFWRICVADATSSWLGAFRRGITQEYVIEWGEEQLRLFTNGERIETSPGVAYEVSTPYAAAEAPYLSLQQSFDRLYIDHASHPPAALRRDDAVTFAHEVLVLENGPFADANSDESVTVSASGASGSITLTASGGSIFETGHIGSAFRLEAGDFGNVPAWEAGMKDITAGDFCHNEGKVYQAATSGTTGQVQPTHTEGSYYDGQLTNDLLNDKGPYGVKWTYVHDRFGIMTITAVASGTSATATVTRRLPASVVGTGTFRWSLGAFSAAAGWPSLVSIWKGRALHFKDFEIIGTVVGDYGGGRQNFASFDTTGVLAEDLAFRRTISIEDPPLWVARDRKLILGTASREIAIGPTNAAAALSGSNISADDQSFYGSEPVMPIQCGTETLFVERGGRRLRSADFDFARDRYDAADLTAAARHMAGEGSDAGFVQLAYQKGPQALVLAVRRDGQIAVHPKSRLEIKGFARMRLGGGARCLSAVSIFGEDGRTEELWALIERTAGDGVTTLREIWKQASWRELGDAQEEAFYVDGGVRFEAAANQTEFTGLEHLAGQAVAVLANGGVVKGLTVSDAGVLTLPAEDVPSFAFTVIVGLGYAAEAVGMRPEISINGQSMQGAKRRIVQLAVRVLETLGIRLGDGADNPTREVIDRPASAQMDKAIPLASGDYGGEVETDHDREGRPRWLVPEDEPVPAIVTAAMMNIDVDQGGDLSGS